MVEEKQEIIVGKSIDEEFTRTNHLPNSEGLTDEEKELKIKQVKELVVLYPTVPEAWLDMVWHFHFKNPEKCDEIMKNNLWREPSTKYDSKGGIIKCVELLDGIRETDDAPLKLIV